MDCTMNNNQNGIIFQRIKLKHHNRKKSMDFIMPKTNNINKFNPQTYITPIKDTKKHIRVNSSIDLDNLTEDELLQLFDEPEQPKTENLTKAKHNFLLTPLTKWSTPITNKKNNHTFKTQPKPIKCSISFQLFSSSEILITFSHTPNESIIQMLNNNKFVSFPSREIYTKYKGPYIKYNQVYKEISLLSNKLNGIYSLKALPRFPLDCITQRDKIPLLKFIDQNNKTFKIDYIGDSNIKYQNQTLLLLPENIKYKLYTFQLKCIEEVVKYNCRVIIYDEIGIDKTIDAIALMTLFPKDWPILIICPNSLKLHWKNQIIKFLKVRIPTIANNIFIISNVNDLNTISSAKRKHNTVVCITSYDIASKSIVIFKDKFPEINFIICDEAQYLKHKDSKRTKTLIPYIQKSKRILLMTGVPLIERPIELFPLLQIIRPDIFKDFNAFGLRYCSPQHKTSGIDWRGRSNIEEFNYIMQMFIIKRSKNDVINELPYIKIQKIEIKEEGKYINDIKVLLNKVKIDFIKEIANIQTPQYEDIKNLNINENLTPLNCFVKAFGLTGEEKVNSIRDYVSYVISKECKCVLYAYHQFVLDGIEQEMIIQKQNYIRIDENICDSKRHELINKFQSEQHCLFAILSITACFEGISLSYVDNIVFCELYFDPSIMLKAEGICNAKGERKWVNIYYLFLKDTVDDILYFMVEKKRYEMNKVVKRDNIKKEGELNMSEGDKKKDDNMKESIQKRKRYRSNGDDFIDGNNEIFKYILKDDSPSKDKNAKIS